MPSHSRMGAFDDRPQFSRADAWVCSLRPRWRQPALAQNRRSRQQPASRQRPEPTRPTSRRRRRRSKARRMGRSQTRPRSSLPRQSARSAFRTSRMSVIALGTRRLDQLNISNFEEYTKQLPSVSYQHAQSGGTVVYMRGVATGGDGNHSGSLPSVGVYLDEQPVTTIGGALDVHIYDIARIESLAGPQGTLYGASSEAGTIRIITNKPDLDAIYGRVDGELNTVDSRRGGRQARRHDQRADRQAHRLPRRRLLPEGRGLHRQCAGIAHLLRRRRSVDSGRRRSTAASTTASTSTMPHSCGTISTTVTTYGGRAALKIDLDDNWTVTPTIMHQILQAGRLLRLRSLAR